MTQQRQRQRAFGQDRLVELPHVVGPAQLAQVPVAEMVGQRLAGIVDRVTQYFGADLEIGQEAAGM